MMVSLRRVALWMVASALVLSVVRAAAGDTPLIDAVKAGDMGSMRALIGRSIDVNQPAGDGGTALHWAVYHENQEAVDLLLRSGANVNSANALGVTSLWIASDHGDTPRVAQLLAAGADANLAPQTGDTADARIAERRRRSGETAAKSRRERQRRRGSEWADGPDVGDARRHADVVGLLLQAGADVRVRSRSLKRVGTALLSDVARRSGRHSGNRSGRIDAPAVCRFDRRHCDRSSPARRGSGRQ